ncbi:hypothetical protein ACLD9W_05580 [Neisseria sp. WLZKY-1]|uniref:hypothetical protein n=1 Tax=Neisseria sp. WLZKY-1 TaxID=3390377 RepID=UPI00397BA177
MKRKTAARTHKPSYGVFHADQLATLSPKHYDAETSRLFYNCVCQAAEATGCRVK